MGFSLLKSRSLGSRTLSRLAGEIFFSNENLLRICQQAHYWATIKIQIQEAFFFGNRFNQENNMIKRSQVPLKPSNFTENTP
jgi:hypothetical protein